MKKERIKSVLLAAVCWLAAWLPVCGQSYAQPDKGYWQVHTDPNARNTVVQFYDGGNHLLYQESMARKYVKLTRRNIRLFDDLLGKLMARELLSEKVRAYELVADSRSGFMSEAASSLPASEVNAATAMSNVYVVQSGRMKVVLKNPTLESYDIRIMDSELRTIYYERTQGPTYGRWFDMSKLGQGTYKVHITSSRKKLNYKLLVDDFVGYRLESL